MNAHQRRQKCRRSKHLIWKAECWCKRVPDPWMSAPWTPEEAACFEGDEEPEPWNLVFTLPAKEFDDLMRLT